MKFHHLKTWPHFFREVKNGKKTFEVRKNDRDYDVGDILVLQEYDTKENRYTGDELRVIVTYILSDPQFVKEGHVIMAIKRGL